MRDVIIQAREESESHPQDQVLYAAIHAALRDKATELRLSGEFEDRDIIAMSVRAAQQLACNATAISAEMGISLVVADEA